MPVGRRTRMIAVVVGVLLGGTAVWGLSVTREDRDPGVRATLPTSTGATVPMIVPGRPGESASVVPADRLPPAGDVGYNLLDAWFVQMMIPHHQQALELAALVPSRAADPRIRAVAERITVAQGPEIAVLRSWLRQRGLTESGLDHGHGHDHGPASGMHPPEAIRALAATSGAAFDRSFVDLMSAHHQGAIQMCTRVLTGGADDDIQRLATNIAADQQIEISRMREITER
jgi:uncharacterized protein (DUF305 family)